MKKNISLLAEVNRVREMMGVKVLLEQDNVVGSRDDDKSITKSSVDVSGKLGKDKKDETKEKDELGFFTIKNNKFKSILQSWKEDLWQIQQQYKFPFNNEGTFSQNIITSIGGGGSDNNRGSIFTNLFNSAQTNWKYLATVLAGEYLWVQDEENVSVRLVQTTGNWVGLRYTDSDGEETENLSPSELCKKLNAKNQLSLGQTQITGIRFPGTGNMNKGIRTNLTDGLCLYSATKTTQSYKQTDKITKDAIEGEDAIEATVSAQGEPIEGGGAFNVYEVAPDLKIVDNIVKQIQQGKKEGQEVVNVVINGVASTKPVASDKIETWKTNVGEPWNEWGNDQILKVVEDGTFTKPVTGNQLLAYLRAQNLGKALEKAGGIKVTNYNYSVGGNEMKVNVMVGQETPGTAAVDAVDAVDAVTTPTGKVEKIKQQFSGSIYKVTINFPKDYKSQFKQWVRGDKELKVLAKAMIARDTVLDLS